MTVDTLDIRVGDPVTVQRINGQPWPATVMALHGSRITVATAMARTSFALGGDHTVTPRPA